MQNKSLLYIFLSLVICQGCLEENPSDSGWSALTQILSLTTEPAFQEQNACVVTYTNGVNRYSMCFQHSTTECSWSSFNDIPDAATLQERIDDLTFISINYGNCSATTGTLGTIYNNLTSPASMIFKDLIDFNGPYIANKFTFTNTTSCQALGLTKTPYVTAGFERMLDSAELKRVKGVETELSMRAATTNLCIDDLAFQPDYKPMVLNLRDKIYKTGIACSHQTSAGYSKCNW